MSIHPLASSDVPRWIEMRARLWPEDDPLELDVQGRAALTAEPPLAVFIAMENESAVGFLELGLRSIAEGCSSSPVPYIEGWYVDPSFRRRGIGAALVNAGEDWSRDRGYTEIASDTQEWNRLSREVHAALGFEEVETVVVFRKTL